MTFKIRPMDERDLEPMAALTFYMWHDFYGSLVPQKFANERYPRKACEEKQMRILLNCKQFPDKHKSMVAIGDTGELLGACYISKSGDKPRVANVSDLPDFDTELHRLYIWPQARNKGLGSQFLREFVPWFEANGYESCFAWSFDDNPCNFFYDKRGAKAHKKIKADYAGKKLSLTAYAWNDFVDAFKA